jgi:hypothetical protein
MPAPTCLFNSNRREYVILGSLDICGVYLSKLETTNNWDLRRDDIFIMLTRFTNNYNRVFCSIDEGGGLIEHELLSKNSTNIR